MIPTQEQWDALVTRVNRIERDLDSEQKYQTKLVSVRLSQYSELVESLYRRAGEMAVEIDVCRQLIKAARKEMS